MEIDLADLAGRAANGDRAALDDLWRSHRAWLAAVVAAHCGRGVLRSEIEDLLQEIALNVVRNISNLRDPDRCRAWLRAVAVNTVRTAARRRSAAPHGVTLNGDGGAAAGAHGLSLAGPASSDLVDEVMRLPLIYREPLLLRGVRGLTTRHVSEVLDLPFKTVETRLTRGRRLLLDALARSRDDRADSLREHIAVKVNDHDA